MRDGTILPHLLRQFILPHTNLKFTESENNPQREVESERERGGGGGGGGERYHFGNRGLRDRRQLLSDRSLVMKTLEMKKP